ncbi:T9SS type A sorting domain-containing protein [Aridibaculum aurantiacum]|uniref:T9SS type A sorting domain-containing protein n=1 Tax=Aridibaculum aurantiacum TaxID=2810307 RepID=UPI001A9582C8|nr:T9SS type A sorting domain-containing protein [Aridibaculum aurantiacum]
MKKIFTLTILFFFAITGSTVLAQQATVYATVNSGSWGSSAIWETFSSYTAAMAATPGSGSPASSVPSGTHNVLIRNGHTVTMGASNRGCKSIIIANGGKLWANETTARRLQLGAGGTGFTYPLVDTVQVDGALGGASDGLFIESGTNAQHIKIFGSGTIDIQRIRTIGGSGATDATTPGVLMVDIDANINLWQASNYALSLVYNPATTDNYTLTIFPNRTVTVKEPTAYAHNSQNSTNYGRYTYNIKGTLDLTASTANNNYIVPAPATSRLTVNVDGGNWKLGTNFRADTSQTSPVSAGILQLSLTNNGRVDATMTTNFNVGKTFDGSGNVRDLVFGTDGTSFIRRTAGTSEVNFPVGVTGPNTPNDVNIVNTGTPDQFEVSVKSTFDVPVPDPSRTLNRQWTINETVPGGSVATVRLAWVAADQPASFNPNGQVYILRYNGTNWNESYPATVTGTGTANDPYVATATGITLFSPFTVSNSSVLPLNLVSFNAKNDGTGNKLTWTTTNEQNVSHFEVETSVDGRDFRKIGSVTARNTGANSSYDFAHAVRVAGTVYYRLKMVDKDGTFTYSSVVKITTSTKGDFTISPNPVKGGVANLQLANLEKGTYTISLFNSIGQVVLNRTIDFNGGVTSFPLQLPGGTKSGIYNLQLRNGAEVITKKVIVE